MYICRFWGSFFCSNIPTVAYCVALLNLELIFTQFSSLLTTGIKIIIIIFAFTQLPANLLSSLENHFVGFDLCAPVVYISGMLFAPVAISLIALVCLLTPQD